MSSRMLAQKGNDPLSKAVFFFARLQNRNKYIRIRNDGARYFYSGFLSRQYYVGAFSERSKWEPFAESLLFPTFAPILILGGEAGVASGVTSTACTVDACVTPFFLNADSTRSFLYLSSAAASATQ